MAEARRGSYDQEHLVYVTFDKRGSVADARSTPSPVLTMDSPYSPKACCRTYRLSQSIDF
ncbi:hypothetical protein BN2475_260049 [Paraburkholderia ribeironis]|uniref:Uncharacterized protein n=1 Tax=Paraburkholderia ribeironis TaxID=1247936 RepID=A0A1N7S0U5_9BURK|nr:hypothetical protein BN2475_260049 [Paraburkholderia ribeironis]